MKLALDFKRRDRFAIVTLCLAKNGQEGKVPDLLKHYIYKSPKPLATVVIGGLISATLLTLLVLPALYPWFCCARRFAGAIAHDAPYAPQPAE